MLRSRHSYIPVVARSSNFDLNYQQLKVEKVYVYILYSEVAREAPAVTRKIWMKEAQVHRILRLKPEINKRISKFFVESQAKDFIRKSCTLIPSHSMDKPNDHFLPGEETLRVIWAGVKRRWR